MVQFTNIALAALASVGVMGAPAESALEKRQNTPNGQGTHDGYFWSWWSDGNSPATYENLSGGSYKVSWQQGGNVVGGKGWQPGTSDRSITYSGTYSPNGNSYLAIYGWMRNPLVEYYVVENFGTYDPSSGGNVIGSVQCGGATYKLAESWRYNAPSIDGNQDFQQYWSIREDKRSSGTVDMACHFEAWAAAGLPMGDHDYQILATEGYDSSGSAEMTVS